jgi:multiple sugar transport system permease protein
VATVTSVKQQGQARGSKRALNGEALTAWLFILPALIGFILFYALPAARGLYISFTDWNLLRDPTFIGGANYREMIADPLFWNALKITGIYVLANIPLQTALGLLLAALMSRLTTSMLVRGTLILPYLLSNVIVALIWLWMLDPLLGFVNAFLQTLGFTRQPFFGSPDQAIWTIAFINIWRHMGFTALLFYAGMQGIPGSLYEAARIDGASENRMFWGITLPLLRPVTVFVVVTSLIGSFQIFDTVAVTTAGGPVNSTKVLVWYIYENAFQFSRMGYATALSMTLFAILIVITLLQLRFFRSDESDLTGA